MTVLWSFAFSLFSEQIFPVMASRRDPGGPRKLLETIREKQVRWSNVKRQFSLQVCTTRCKNDIHLNSRMSRSKYNLLVLIQAWQELLLCFKIPWIVNSKLYRFNFFENIFSCVYVIFWRFRLLSRPPITHRPILGGPRQTAIQTVDRLEVNSRFIDSVIINNGYIRNVKTVIPKSPVYS